MMIKPVTQAAVAGAPVRSATGAGAPAAPGGTFAGGVGNARQKFMASLPQQVQALRGGAGGWNDFRAALNPQQQAELGRIRTGEGRAGFDRTTGAVVPGTRPPQAPPRMMGPPQQQDLMRQMLMARQASMGGPRPMAPGPGQAPTSLMPVGQSSAPYRQPMPPQNIQSGGSPAQGMYPRYSPDYADFAPQGMGSYNQYDRNRAQMGWNQPQGGGNYNWY